MAKQIKTKLKKPTNENKKNVNSSIKKLKILVTVVNRSKGIFYLDLLEQFEVNMQTVIYGRGTADKEIFNLIKVDENEKVILLSVVREDKINEIMETLSEKFKKVKNGKGIAFTVPMQSLIGVSAYQFLSNNRTNIEGVK